LCVERGWGGFLVVYVYKGGGDERGGWGRWGGWYEGDGDGVGWLGGW